ncbi:MAG: hypothetical protein ABIT47_02020 [Candidatus Paceibacterota bacterium]
MNPDDVKTIVPKTDATFTQPSDPSQYIRTYAKDVAALTNSPAPTPTAAPAKPETTDDNVTVPEYDASPVNHGDNPSSPKEFKSEVVALSKDDSDGIFSGQVSAQAPAPSPMSVMPQASIGVTPNVVPEETAQEREAILARLRAKLASHSPANVIEPAQPIVVPLPEEPIVPVPQPIIAETPKPPQFMPPAEPRVVPLPVREPVAPVPPAPRPQEVSASPIHTFTSDFSDRIDSQKASTFSVLASQSDAGPSVIKRSNPRSRLVPVLAGALLLVLGIGIVAAAYLYTKKTPTVPVVAGVPSLITFDESVEVKGTGIALMKNIADIAGQTSVSGNVIVTYITTPSVAGSGIPQPGGAIIRQLPLDAPDILIRNIDDSSTVGTIHAGNESRPFLVLRVNSYERTFAGMLAWEPTMTASLLPFFPTYTDVSTAVVATTTLSTSTTTNVAIASPFFTDAVVANHDVRILRDSKGRSLILYGYQGKDTLIIARDEAAFTAIIARLTATVTP